jgi:ubiquinone/menaquinone biosynthesis C-methylase UbiE
MSATIKENVSEFNRDVAANGSYLYTQDAQFSSIVSNGRMTKATVEVIRLNDTIRSVIDIGCGDGTYTAELQGQLPHINFTGFDPASVAIDNAAQKFPQCSFWVGDVLDASTFPKEQYDLAIIRGVIHHLPTQSKAIKNAALLSKRVLIIEPNGNNPIVKWIEQHSQYHIKHEEQSFTTEFIENICRENGFKVTYSTYIGFVPFFFPTLPSRIIYFFQPLLEKIPLLGKYFGGQLVLLAEQKSSRQG